MMRKSSLGRRSSIPVRVSGIGGSSAQRPSCSGGKKSMLRPPGFTQNSARRSRSEDRDSYGGSRQLSGNRASSVGRNLAVQTPYTPLSVHPSLPKNSARPARSQTMSTDSNRRASSVGGKNSRKDSRPITEKSFQQAALAKVQVYFDSHTTDFLNPGQSIRPMNLKLFVDLVDYLLKEFDPKFAICKSTYIDDLPPLMRKMGYRSKIDKSWLVTVNTIHSWPHVIALLSWLVEAIEAMNAVDAMDLLYPPSIDDRMEEDTGEDDSQEPITKDCLLHIKKTWRYKDDHSNDRDTILDNLNTEYVKRQIIEQRITDEDLNVIETEVNKLEAHVLQENQRKNELTETVKEIIEQLAELSDNCKSMEEFIKKSKAYVNDIQSKFKTIDDEIEIKASILAKEKEDLRKIEERLNAQQFTVEDKEKMSDEKRDLHRMILFHENEIREYEKSAFPVDLEIARDQKKLQDAILEYNKNIGEKLVDESRLRGLEMKFSLMSNSETVDTRKIDSEIQALKKEFKNDIRLKQQSCEELKLSRQTEMEEEKFIEENIEQERKLLEAVENDIRNKEDSLGREASGLKEEINHFQALVKQLDDDISKLNTSSIEEQEIEYQYIVNDIEEIKKRYNSLLSNMIKKAMEREIHAREVLKENESLIIAAEEKYKKITDSSDTDVHFTC